MKRASVEKIVNGMDTNALRRRCGNLRYGPPGIILFDFDGKTYKAKEPRDVLPVMYPTHVSSLLWAAKQYYEGAELA